MDDVVKSFLKCRQRMHKSFPGDYERKGKTCFAVRLFGKKMKNQLEIQVLRVFKDMTFFRSRCFKISNKTFFPGAGDRHTSEICRVITPARIIDGSNKTTTLGLRHGT